MASLSNSFGKKSDEDMGGILVPGVSESLSSRRPIIVSLSFSICICTYIYIYMFICLSNLPNLMPCDQNVNV